MATITLRPLPTTKLALHSTRHPFSTIHGLLIGYRDDGGIEITDAIPVCHEVPTKPVVDMALRLVDIHLQQQQSADKQGEIMGWYTSNVSGGEIPNVPALKIASVLEQQQSGMILILVDVDVDGPKFTMFEKGKNFTSRIEEERIKLSSSDVAFDVIKSMSTSEYEKGIEIYDYVDHVSNYFENKDLDERDWIENRAVADFIERIG